ncbi:hypothetical protein L2E82_20276 [Cichorium intybus]|uniref:Uncharacterized protein n=1 Tax=Cichorium intybus TaxID=13427 RepID=A0ACB9DT89_CICIN|nr:hypothetical protein L2E82_20276 [Cichorium intybus]
MLRRMPRRPKMKRRGDPSQQNIQSTAKFKKIGVFSLAQIVCTHDIIKGAIRMKRRIQQHKLKCHLEEVQEVEELEVVEEYKEGHENDDMQRNEYDDVLTQEDVYVTRHGDNFVEEMFMGQMQENIGVSMKLPPTRI